MWKREERKNYTYISRQKSGKDRKKTAPGFKRKMWKRDERKCTHYPF